MNFPTEFDPARKQVRACEVCGEPTSSGSRCTNGRCAKCHVEHCTPGGATSPGHGRGTVATPFAERKQVAMPDGALPADSTVPPPRDQFSVEGTE